MREWKTASRTLNGFNCERKEDSWLPVARRNCRGDECAANIYGEAYTEGFDPFELLLFLLCAIPVEA